MAHTKLKIHFGQSKKTLAFRTFFFLRFSHLSNTQSGVAAAATRILNPFGFTFTQTMFGCCYYCQATTP